MTAAKNDYERGLSDAYTAACHDASAERERLQAEIDKARAKLAHLRGLDAALCAAMNVLEELERVVDDPTVKDADWRSAVRAAFLLAATP